MADPNETWAAIAPLLGQLIAEAVREALHRERRTVQFEPAQVVSVEGSDVQVIPDSGAEEISAISVDAAIVAGSRTMLVYGPGGLCIALGPIADPPALPT